MKKSDALSPELIRILDARHHDPFEVLGCHPEGDQRERIRVFLPHAEEVSVVDGPRLERIPNTDFFQWSGPAATVGERYRLRWRDTEGNPHERHDPYCFPPQVGDLDLHLFGEGRHWHAYRFLGAQPHSADGAEGTRFVVWAPAAERISVVGDFNRWDGRVHPMRVRGASGVWELFIPDIGEGIHYKFEIRNRDSGAIFLKSDPYGQRYEMRPGTASITVGESPFQWRDGEWLKRRESADWLHSPMSVYEVHLGSWRRDRDGNFLGYRELAHQLVAHVEQLGFTHIELLPVSEHPLDASWGYQCLGYYAPTSRHGSPDDFRYFVDHCHQHGIGIILDWVPAHFPKDAHGLARFDGTALYEHEDPRQGEHRDWSTLIFNYGRNEVKNFLLSNALYWLEEFHLDGLRVDAVASMLYLDYSREAGEWVPNKYGGRENLEAIDFLRELNHVAHGEHPGALIVAEESTAWPQVTRPTYVGGLGFSMKWNMGWMNDTLEYFHKEPVFRAFHHDWLTFSMLYAFTENFVLPFSHDEVVHGKGSMLDKMPGDAWQKFANLRLLYCYQYLHPGKKLLFMGCEFGQGKEWDFDGELDWHLLDYPYQNGVQALVRDLNQLYRGEQALHGREFEWDSFEWIDCHDSSQSTLSFLRKDEDRFLVVVLNFTPEPRHEYRIGVPARGTYREVLNSDSEYYAGSNTGNDVVTSDEIPWMGRDHSVVLTLPPLAAIVLRLEE